MADANQVIDCRLLLIGNASVGKSSLLLRFTDKTWLPEDEASATIVVDFRVSTQTLYPSRFCSTDHLGILATQNGD